MASLQKYSVRGVPYYRIVESRRINGKPTPVPIMYLGPANKLVERLLSSATCDRVRSFQHGDVAALKAVADDLDAVSIINRHVKARHQLSTGAVLLLAAINRAVDPCSKRAWADWAGGTSISRLFKIDVSGLTSQLFWNWMDELSQQDLEAIENELVKKTISMFNIKVDTLFYDPTNFFTFIDSGNQRSTLAQRGHSKQKRFDLRQFNLALLVSRDGQIPLCSHTYKGDVPDCKSFPDSLAKIKQRLENMSVVLEDITIVYDKGNNSKINQAMVDGNIHYVASLTPSQHTKLLNTPSSEYQTYDDGYLAGMHVFMCKRSIWGAERTIVLFISDRLRQKQIRGLEQHLSKAIKQLEQWQNVLASPRSGSRSAGNATKKMTQILSAQYVDRILKVAYDDKRSGAQRLSWHIDSEALMHLHQDLFGKRILMTDRHDWSDEEIIRAYNGQSKVENTFRRIKDPDHLAVRPQFHWTDQKIKVHVFICLLALLLTRLLERKASAGGHVDCVPGLLDQLRKIRLAMLLSPSSNNAGRPRCHWQIEETDTKTLALFQSLVPGDASLVYTPSNA